MRWIGEDRYGPSGNVISDNRQQKRENMGPNRNSRDRLGISYLSSRCQYATGLRRTVRARRSARSRGLQPSVWRAATGDTTGSCASRGHRRFRTACELSGPVSESGQDPRESGVLPQRLKQRLDRNRPPGERGRGHRSTACRVAGRLHRHGPAGRVRMHGSPRPRRSARPCRAPQSPSRPATGRPPSRAPAARRRQSGRVPGARARGRVARRAPRGSCRARRRTPHGRQGQSHALAAILLL